MKNENEWIICFGSKLSSPSVYTEKQLIKRFYADGYNILWINPIPHINISIKGISQNRSTLVKILLRLKTQLNIFSKVKKNFYQINPLFFPIVENNFMLNMKLLKFQIIVFSKILGIKKKSIFSSGLTDIPYIFPHKKFNYFVQISGDLYSDLRNLTDSLKQQIKIIEKRVFNYATFILAASQNINTKIKSIIEEKNKVIYFPHGVETEHFKSNTKNKLLNINKPIIGYFGSLTENNDQRMFISLANAGFSVVLIGKVLGDYSSCANKNIHFIGAVDYKDLPNYANNFDVCIMAWKPAEWINNSNPSKTLEYFAMGKPIVSNTIPELKERFSQLMYFADEPGEFVEKVRIALQENNCDLIRQRVEIADKESWDEKYLLLKKLINK